MPWVGELPHEPGLYVCAGFCGNGLWRAFGCGVAVAEIIGGDKPHAWVDAWVPDMVERPAISDEPCSFWSIPSLLDDSSWLFSGEGMDG